MPEDTKEQRAAYIRGLLEERHGAEIYDKPERVKAIDAELARMGHEAKAPAKRAETRPASADTTERR
jgi:hypothetical protein